MSFRFPPFFLAKEGVVDMIEVSETTGREFDADDLVFFRNPVQSAYYIKWGAILYDLFVDSKDRLVFCFSREDHDKYKRRWGTKGSNGAKQ